MNLSRISRIFLIQRITDTHSEITTSRVSGPSQIRNCEDGLRYFITPHPAFNETHDVYLFPFLLNSDGSSWEEANVFLFHRARDKERGFASSDAVREKASMLLEYKIFCEENGIDLNNFECRKPMRPTYRYFNFLFEKVNKEGLSRYGLNKRTKIVFELYRYLASRPNSVIDIDKVDTAKSVRIFIRSSNNSSLSVNVEKRSLSLSVPKNTTSTPIGFVREYGEDLRPLKDNELKFLTETLETHHFAVDERLIHYLAMHTGARKQSILTMRLKHLASCTQGSVRKDRTFEIIAGPGTGIDTKYQKLQRLYIPDFLVERLKAWVNSPLAKKRREKFIRKNGNIFRSEDLYLFLSPEGEPHYMAKDDPRYKVTKSRPQGRNTFYMKKKLIRYSSGKVPADFTFHWLRATFGLRYYRWLQPLAADGKLSDGDIISMVQRRLHHSDRAITERYLRLFDSIDDRLSAQQIYEERALHIYPEKL